MTNGITRWLARATLAAVAVLALGVGVPPAWAEDEPVVPAGDPQTYEQVKQRDMLSFDFMLAHPEGKEPEGLTPEEAQQVRDTLKGGADQLLAMQAEDGTIDVHNAPVYRCGSHALALWTILECGRPTTDPAVAKAIAAMLMLAEKRMPVPAESDDAAAKAQPPGVAGLRTYCASLVLVSLYTIARARASEAEAAELAKRIADGRSPPKLPKQKPEHERTATDVANAAKELQKQLTREEIQIGKAAKDTLTKRQTANGSWDYMESDAGGARGDGSNAHFCMFGLLAAHRIGLGAPAGFILNKAEDYWTKAQQASGPDVTLRFREPTDSAKASNKRVSGTRNAQPRTEKVRARGWGYRIEQPKVGEEDDSTLSMSSAGVICLSIIRYLKVGGTGTARGSRLVVKLDAALLDGLAWMHETLSRAHDASEGKRPEAPKGESAEAAEARRGREQRREYPTNRGWPAYTMLAVERAGILNGCDFFGTCEWYPLGARRILGRLADLRSKLPEGSKPSLSADTCMYLLFLKGYLDKTPEKKPGPEITGKDRPREE